MQKREASASAWGSQGVNTEAAPGAGCRYLSMILLSTVDGGRGHCWPRKVWGPAWGDACVFGENERRCGYEQRVSGQRGDLWLLLTRVLGLLNQQELIRNRTGSSGES